MISRDNIKTLRTFTIYKMAGEVLRNELLEKTQQLLQLTQDFEEFQETSKAFESELEQELETQMKNNQNLQEENEKLKDEIKALKVKSI